MKKSIFSLLLAMLLGNAYVFTSHAQDNKIFETTALDAQPEYPGGMSKFYKELATNLKYPPAAAKANISGTVNTSFIIEKDGSINDIKVVSDKKIGGGLEEETIRIIKASKKWKAGVKNGKAVRTKYMLPVKFILPKNNTNTNSTPITTTKPPVTDNDKVYDHVTMKTPPTYTGGMANYYRFLSKNINYPNEAFAVKKTGTAMISFIIEKNGSVSNVKAEGKALGYGLDEEAVRVVKLADQWNPGVLNGQKVRVKYNLPIKFSMKK